MPHWHHAETPFGNIVYSLTLDPTDGHSAAEKAATIYAHGVGTLSAADALTTNYQGDTVPDWDAMKAEARRIADDAGAPFPAWYSPNPGIVVNGKSYSDGIAATFWRPSERRAKHPVWITSGGLTDAADRKLCAWLEEHRAELIDGDAADAERRSNAVDTYRDAVRNLTAARLAHESATRAWEGAERALANLGIDPAGVVVK